ncbi:MAG: hypothetical protein J4469_00865 [Candidatus Aenigmarchaeota archaeon]|nr:hypothetical protein [Candidatus Aenigmarchaeota archaeon]
MKIVLKIGGSISINENGPVEAYFRKLLPVIRQIKTRHRLILWKEEMEWIAIELLRVNVRFLSSLLNMKPLYRLEEISTKTTGVIGGIKPGRSTDANAAYCAAKIKADLFVKLTNVDGIYDKDPRKHKDARKLETLSFADLKKFSQSGKPGSYGILDRLAIETITKHKIKTVIMNGKDPKNILKLINGEKIGTLIH